MKLIDLDANKDYILGGEYKVEAGSDYLPVSKQIKKLLQEIAQKKQDNDCIKREDAINVVSSLVRDEEIFLQEYAIDRIKRIPNVDMVEVGKAYPREEFEKYGLSEWKDKDGQRWVMVERRDK